MRGRGARVWSVSTAVALTGMANYEVSEYLVAVAILLSP